jgi:hypothetical protein
MELPCASFLHEWDFSKFIGGQLEIRVGRKEGSLRRGKIKQVSLDMKTQHLTVYFKWLARNDSVVHPEISSERQEWSKDSSIQHVFSCKDYGHQYGQRTYQGLLMLFSKDNSEERRVCMVFYPSNYVPPQWPPGYQPLLDPATVKGLVSAQEEYLTWAGINLEDEDRDTDLL